MSESLVKEWAAHFVEKSKEELDTIVGSFRFEQCLKREGLNKILTENATLIAKGDAA